jgi:hypothetical protein
LIFHAVDPASYGPAGSPGIFQALCNLMAEFGFLSAAALGASAGTTDLSEGMFRHLVITGRSRLALYLARIPAGLAIILPLVAVAFTALCLVTSYEGVPQPTSVSVGGVSVPEHFDQAELQSWLLQHPQQAANDLPLGPAPGAAQIRSAIDQNIASLYGEYTSDEVGGSNPAMNEMAKIGLWLELEVGIGFMVGLGLGSLTGHRLRRRPRPGAVRRPGSPRHTTDADLGDDLGHRRLDRRLVRHRRVADDHPRRMSPVRLRRTATQHPP